MSKNVNHNLAASRLHEILRKTSVHLVNRGLKSTISPDISHHLFFSKINMHVTLALYWLESKVKKGRVLIQINHLNIYKGIYFRWIFGILANTQPTQRWQRTNQCQNWTMSLSTSNVFIQIIMFTHPKVPIMSVDNIATCYRFVNNKPLVYIKHFCKLTIHVICIANNCS